MSERVTCPTCGELAHPALEEFAGKEWYACPSRPATAFWREPLLGRERTITVAEALERWPPEPSRARRLLRWLLGGDA